MNFWIKLFDISYPEILGIYRFHFEKRKGACLSFRFLLIGFRKLLDDNSRTHSHELLQNINQKPRKIEPKIISKTQGQKIKPKTISTTTKNTMSDFGLMGIEKF